MLLKREALATVTTWSNGRKAVVDLMEDRDGRRMIRKRYRPGFRVPMFREAAMAAYVAARTSVTPRVLSFQPWRNELFFEYVQGERVLEWVLKHFGSVGLDLAEFQSFRGLNPPEHVDPRIAEAFRRFRLSTSEEALRLRVALRRSYAELHRAGVKHGSADPRNVLFHDGKIFIVDFDNARPSFNAAAIDYRDLEYWFGIRLTDVAL
jgi:predicted Ser/Thr protein kinase